MENRDDNSQMQQDQEHQQWTLEREAAYQNWKTEYESSQADTPVECDLYAEYIMNNCAGDRIICNGDDLVGAMEDVYLWDDFVSKRYEDSLKCPI